MDFANFRLFLPFFFPNTIAVSPRLSKPHGRNQVDINEHTIVGWKLKKFLETVLQLKQVNRFYHVDSF